MLQTAEPIHQSSLHYASAPSAASTIPTAAVPAVKPAPAMAIPNHHHILIVTGPAGCGKSTVAKFLAEHYDYEYIEGDEFHPASNIEKMAQNIPLDDADRWDWLILLRDQALEALKQGAKGVVVTCSALKKKYRDVIRTARIYDEDPNASVHFIYLRASREVLLARVSGRQGHYMKETMVTSQLATLEEPDKQEIERLRDVKIVDVRGGLLEVQKLAIAAAEQILAEESPDVSS
ncbi:P-loop containing nucleoside triphosphate hydrolase protein [Clohesyomyces aquaticus]|uniref:Gluconokinase n=1 Tax=Clohesyomyces aquaticus TaxID=1231657 RepID=A0A1Y1ZZB8_9PLEO|nr:P-loop containing nucleoside triphosphate hydrolase protein [Clohesyomyces aquaticus]